MTAEELRIGNYVNYNGKPLQFKSFFGLCNVESKPDDFKPISLTEEILVNNFDFKNTYKIGNKKYYEHSEYRISFTVVDNCFVFDFGPATIGQREYVHEVQNLFYGLTQKEVKFKLTK